MFSGGVAMTVINSSAGVLIGEITVMIVDADVGHTDGHAPHHQVRDVREAGLFLGHHQPDVHRQLLKSSAVRQPLRPAAVGAAAVHGAPL